MRLNPSGAFLLRFTGLDLHLGRLRAIKRHCRRLAGHVVDTGWSVYTMRIKGNKGRSGSNHRIRPGVGAGDYILPGITGDIIQAKTYQGH